jgi:hypothetical protein
MGGNDMMHYTQVVRGLMAYADAEILSKLNGSLKAWMIGGVLELLGGSAERMFRQIQSMPMIDALGVIDGENVDADRLYAILRKQAQRGPATENIRFIGPITFTVSDVDELYRHIKRQEV